MDFIFLLRISKRCVNVKIGSVKYSKYVAAFWVPSIEKKLHGVATLHHYNIIVVLCGIECNAAGETVKERRVFLFVFLHST